MMPESHPVPERWHDMAIRSWSERGKSTDNDGRPFADQVVDWAIEAVLVDLRRQVMILRRQAVQNTYRYAIDDVLELIDGGGRDE